MSRNMPLEYPIIGSLGHDSVSIFDSLDNHFQLSKLEIIYG
ncbi:hypothetical protein Phpb_03629 [Photorhabdus namnaonensis]|uniref:Uncharacterized protein n=1 Tax=Photorhabdus namnaonensis TaxID=1851568 RepID=A0A1B8YEJ2_9GAMM|nr:hypothetical protein Phpb_03629 [Photorhabdus namnaonensis]